MKVFLEKNKNYVLIIFCALCCINIIYSMIDINNDILELAEKELYSNTNENNKDKLINLDSLKNINEPKIDYSVTSSSLIRDIVLSILNIVITLILLIMVYIEEKLKNLRIMNSLE